MVKDPMSEPATSGSVVLTIGNPNTGKSSLFNALTGLNQKVSNFPGVTVDYLTGKFQLGAREINLVDVPGTYSIAAQSTDEMIAIDALLGNIPNVPAPDAVILVIDATNLRRNLFLASQVRELSMRFIIALTMTDIAEARKIEIDCQGLSEAIKAPVIPIVASTGKGLAALRESLADVLAGFVFESTPRIQRFSRLVERNRQHTIVAIVRILHAVAVVGIDIDVGDAITVRQ
jgi:ferrous iron transport protein B